MSASVVLAVAASLYFSFLTTGSSGETPVGQEGVGIFFVGLIPAAWAMGAFLAERSPMPRTLIAVNAFVLVLFFFFPTSISAYYLPSALTMVLAAITFRKADARESSNVR